MNYKKRLETSNCDHIIYCMLDDVKNSFTCSQINSGGINSCAVAVFKVPRLSVQEGKAKIVVLRECFMHSV